MDSNYTQYVDTDILGTVDNAGLITQYVDKEAVQNSITMWLTSFHSDILRNPNRGGYVVQHLYKPMTESTKTAIRNAIVDGFEQDYYPTAILKNIEIISDYSNKTWIINLKVYVSIIKDVVDVEAILKNFV